MKATDIFRVEVKKSVFLGRAFHVEAQSEVKGILAAVHREHPKCNHVVWAFVLDEKQAGYSDDGEPKGTAGKPCLRILRYSGRHNLLITVVRYFGGTKLGTGGLQRAYSQCAQGVLRMLPPARLDHVKRCKLSFAPAHQAAIRRLLKFHHGTVESAGARENVELFCSVPDNQADAFAVEFQNITRGNGILKG